jgi:hypothetical protein
MSQTALLVSEQRFKQWTQLDDNVRMNEITPFILQAQDIYMQDTLGTKFYTRLKNGIIANDLTADEQLLLREYIAPTLMNYALYMMMPSLKYKFVNQGIVSGTSEGTTPTTLDELQYLRQTTLDTAEFYNKRLLKYFYDNPTMFVDYQSPGTDGMMPNKDNPYFSGLVVPNNRLNYYEERYGDCSDCGPSTTIQGNP